MRMAVLGVALMAMMLISGAGRAQVGQSPLPPSVTETPDWQLRGEPVFYSGDFYERTGPDVFFDANVMVRTGEYRGTPLYTDTTLQPFSVVFVPVGRNLMRPYEKRRIGELAGTTGSRAPSFPGVPDGISSSPAGSERGPVPETEIVSTGGVSRAPRTPSSTIVESIPRPRSNGGVWIEFSGTRWYADGPAESFAPERFTRVGTYRGFPIYQLKNGPRGLIYVPAVAGGPVTPYRRRS